MSHSYKQRSKNGQVRRLRHPPRTQARLNNPLVDKRTDLPLPTTENFISIDKPYQGVMSFIDENLGVVLESRVEFHNRGVQVVSERYGLLVDLSLFIGEPSYYTHESETQLVDLGMSDIEYAQALSEGRNPLHENAVAQALIRAGVNRTQAQQVSPLFGEVPRSPAEQDMILSFWRDWCSLRKFKATVVEEAMRKINLLHYPAYLCGFLYRGVGVDRN